ncbi:hypothetical protein NUACC21_54510 [Scytonema sp. NUACC21]
MLLPNLMNDFFFTPIYGQVNFGLNTAFFNGLFLFLLGIAYLIATIIILIRRHNNMSSLSKLLYLGQALIAVVALPLSGIVLIFQGWRLDPILQFQQFLLTVSIIYLGIKYVLVDFIDNRSP